MRLISFFKVIPSWPPAPFDFCVEFSDSKSLIDSAYNEIRKLRPVEPFVKEVKSKVLLLNSECWKIFVRSETDYFKLITLKA